MHRFVALALLFVALIVPPAFAQQGKDTLRLETTKGNIVIRLRRDLAPNHADRLLTLAREKYYDNVPFHRVIDGFMAQTGDGQRGDGTGGSKYPDLKAEFSKVPYQRGVVGMARKGNSNDSANSQFFIMFGDRPSLNNQYTVVGEVLNGMDVVDKLKKGSEAQNGTVTDPDRIVRAVPGS
jgi:peptidylprolyl isomerase